MLRDSGESESCNFQQNFLPQQTVLFPDSFPGEGTTQCFIGDDFGSRYETNLKERSSKEKNGIHRHRFSLEEIGKVSHREHIRRDTRLEQNGKPRRS